jgi:hypothetical protein
MSDQTEGADGCTESEHAVEAAIDAVERAGGVLREEYKATEVNVETGDFGPASVRLAFEGFASLDAAVERAAEVATDLEGRGWAGDIRLSARGEVGAEDAEDSRPRSTVYADVEVDE